MTSTEQFPVSTIKISQPRRRPEIVARQRLLESLYDQLDKKLILIVAPAGYGKTSLLIDLAANSDLPVCWLSLDTLDQEPQRFLSYVISSIQQRFPEFGKESTSALESLASFEKDSERLLIALTNEINSRIHEHFLLVLDDYHLVDSALPVRLLVNRFIQLSGETIHIILSSRSLPNIPDMPLMIARDMVAGLSYEELSFQPDEIQQYFTQNSRHTLTDKEATKLAQETEGWIAAIHLTSALPSIHPPAQPFGSSGDLFDFFASEVLDKQTPDMREFLLVTALFEAFNASLCEAVLDPLLSGEKRNWASLVASIQANNVFTVPLGPDGKWIRYHNLFRHFLQSRLQYEQPTLAWHIQNGLAQYHEKNRSWEEALHLYESLGDRQSLIRVFALAGSDFIHRGRILTLSNWLEHLSNSVPQENPVMLSLQGAVHAIQGDAQLAERFLSQAEVAFRASGDLDNLTKVLTRRAMAYRRLGDYNQMIVDADETIGLAQGKNDQSLLEAYAEAQRMKGQALVKLGKFDEAKQCYDIALSHYTELGLTSSIPLIEMDIGVLFADRGDTLTASLYYARALAIWEELGDTTRKALLLNNLGVIHHMDGEYEKAFTIFENGLEACEQCGDIRTQALTLCSLGDLLTDVNDFKQARRCFEEALTVAGRLNDNFIIFYSTLSTARLTRLGGQVEEAEAVLTQLVSRQGTSSPYRLSQVDFEQACCRLAAGRHQEAAEIFLKSIQVHQQAGVSEELGKYIIWLSAAYAMFDSKACLDQLDKLAALNLVQLKSSYITLNASQAYPYLSKILESKKANPTVCKFFAKAVDFADELKGMRRRLRQISKRVQITPPSLKIITLGEAQVIRNGAPLSLSDWQTRETRDLFFYLYFHPPQTKEQIATIFWPDITPARLKMRYKTTIYRLRHAVGQEVILYEGERYSFNRGSDYTCDLDDFNLYLEAARNSNEIRQTVDLLQKAVDLVHGPYLANIDADWVMPERVRLQEAYQAVLLRLGELYLELGQAELSLEASRRALLSDPLLEQAHRQRMRAYAALRDQPGLARQYQQCRKTLQKELGLQPTNETERLYEQLIRSF
jgi:ATP/maltotriose-dependent transcriptional regulator MalT/DNA-binding SARP family transcriptional activator